MESVLLHTAAFVELLLGAIAVLLVIVGAVHALMELGKLIFVRQSAHMDKRDIYIHFAQWLVAALTFQLAADIVSTTVAPAWDDIGRVAAIALIRTFLTFFLDRDLEAARQMPRQEVKSNTEPR